MLCGIQRNQRFVFNIKGNDYRLVALIKFKKKMPGRGRT
ncbi:MAG: type II toxin-antitoxin system HigB family toxin [Bacteroidales bacterium]|nr:type II toxin-antitoxin system HigB family toxin [Bacteroidales bacterium]